MKAASLLAILLVASCGGDDSDVGVDEDLPAEGFAVLIEDREEFDLRAEGLTVLIEELRVGGDDGGPWLEVSVRVSNVAEATSIPGLAIVCSGNDDEGGWLAESSTYVLFEELPKYAGTDGVANLLLPGDDRIGEAVPECATPAVLRVQAFGLSDQPAVDVPIPDELVDQLNDAAR